MKTVMCDICKRTQNDLVNKMSHIRHFKMSTWSWLSYDRGCESEFDICDRCLEKISKLKEGGSDD